MFYLTLHSAHLNSRLHIIAMTARALGLISNIYYGCRDLGCKSNIILVHNTC